MVSLSLLAGAGWQFFDDNGDPLAGGLLYIYEAGTVTPAVTYTDDSGGANNANPIVLDAAGRLANQIWMDNGDSYKFVLKTSVGVTVWTEDDITSAAGSIIFTSAGAGLIGTADGGTVQEALDLLGVQTFADIASQTPPASTERLQTSGHTTDGVGAASYRRSAAGAPEATLMPNLIVADALGGYWELAEPVPTLAQGGYVHGTTSAADTSEIITALELFVSTRGHAYRVEGYEDEIEISDVIVPKSGNTVYLDGDLYNSTDNGATAYTGQDAVYQIGYFGAAFLDSSWGAGTPATGYAIGSPVAGYSVTLTAPGAPIVAGDGVIIRSDAHYDGGGGWERPAYGLLTKVVAIDAGLGIITLEHPIDETGLGACKIYKSDNSGTKEAAVPFSMFALFDWTCVGNGSWRSAGSAMSANGGLSRNCRVNIGKLESIRGWYGNMFAGCDFFALTVKVTEKFTDIAYCSHDSRFGGGVWNFDGTGSGTTTGMLFNENSRNCLVYGQVLDMPEYNVGNPMQFRSARNCGYQFTRCYAPATVFAFLREPVFTAASGDTTPVVENNYAEFNEVTCGDRPFDFQNTDSRNFQLRSGRITTTGASTLVGRVYGNNGLIGPGVRINGTGLQIVSPASGWRAMGAFFDEGITGDTKIANTFHGCRWGDFEDNAKSGYNQTVDATATGTALATATFNPGNLETGDQFLIRVGYQAAGAGGTKTVELHIGGAAVSGATSTITAGTQSGVIEVIATAVSNTSIQLSGAMTGSVAGGIYGASAAVNLSTVGTTCDIMPYKAAGADTLVVTSYEITPMFNGA